MHVNKADRSSLPTRRVAWIGVVACLFLSLGCTQRGTWWWAHWGDNDVNGIELFYAQNPNAKSRNEVIKALASCSIKHLYGSYKELPVDQPQWMAAWNSDLHAAGRRSFLLLAEHKWLKSPGDLITELDRRLGPWYSADPPSYLTPQSFFDGIHLDVEPVVYAECKTATLDKVKCHARVVDLIDLVTRVRTWINQNAPDLSLSIDVHHWINEISGPDARVTWPGATSAQQKQNRDAWYTAIADQVNGMTVMAYHPDSSKVHARASWERRNVRNSSGQQIEVRVGIKHVNAKKMLDIATDLEQPTDKRYIDLYDFNELLKDGACK